MFSPASIPFKLSFCYQFQFFPSLDVPKNVIFCDVSNLCVLTSKIYLHCVFFFIGPWCSHHPSLKPHLHSSTQFLTDLSMIYFHYSMQGLRGRLSASNSSILLHIVNSEDSYKIRNQMICETSLSLHADIIVCWWCSSLQP